MVPIRDLSAYKTRQMLPLSMSNLLKINHNVLSYMSPLVHIAKMDIHFLINPA